MTRLLTLALCVAAAAATVAALSTHANASTAGDPRIAVLQKQVKTLQTQVTQLSKALHDTDGQIEVNFASDTCLGAQIADLIQGTWGVVDQIAQATQQKTYFGAQTPVDDYKNCSYLAQPAVPRMPVAVPPSISTLLPILQFLHE
jgi:hypothetical protein